MKASLRGVAIVSCVAVPYGVARYDAEVRGLYDFGSRFSLIWIPLYGALFLLTAFLMGVPTVVRTIREAVLASGLTALIPLMSASIFFLLYDPQIPRFVVAASSAILGAIFLGLGLLNVAVAGLSRSVDRVMVVHDRQESDDVEHSLTGVPESAFAIVGTLSLEHGDPGGLEVSREAKRLRPDVVVLSSGSQVDESVVAEVARMHEDGLRVRSLTSFCDEWLGKVPVFELERSGFWIDIADVHARLYQRLKRLMDVAAALIVLPILVLVTPFVAIANLVSSRGPLFFTQERIGHRGEVFRIRKFRTMRLNTAESGRGEWTALDDPRITRVGNVLRRSHIDELPQVINVLKGELSIVGPRPEQVHYVRLLNEKLPLYMMRHAVRPGLTGWAQVKYPYGASVEDSLEKLQYELHYIRHQSLGLDLRVCVRTVASVLFGRGR